jgi:cell division septation protein DedD
MEKISSYTIGVKLDSLRNGFKLGRVPEALKDPLQALLPRLTGAAAEKPTSIYLFSEDDVAETRDLFAYVLANALAQQMPSTLLVDCSFLDVGLNGVVPHKDGLGFLDLLLYGSSLGVITQETNGGVRVVGAGSFPVTKKMPVALNSFEEAARRLVAQSGCAVFCGPLHDDDGELHPLIGAVDVPIYVNVAADTTTGAVDEVEEQISGHWDRELFSVRITSSEEPAPAATAAASSPPSEQPTEADGDEWLEELEPSREGPEPPKADAEPPPVVVTVEEPVAPSSADGPFEEVPAHAGPFKPEPPGDISRDKHPTEPEWPSPVFDLGEEPALPYHEKRYTALLPKIATAAIAIVVLVFVIWWMNTERNGGDAPSPTQGSAGSTQETATSPISAPGTEPGGVEEGTPADSIAPGTAQIEEGQPPTGTGAETAGGVAAEPIETSIKPEQDVASKDQIATPADGGIDSSDILVKDDLETNWAGWYFIHISSFRESSLARKEVANLESRGFRVFIVFLNLGQKGSWYRVYAGPEETREGARNLKKLLDDTPGVRFTRITQISENP